MILTKEQREEFENVVKPVMEYLGKYHHPHVTIIIDVGRSEILEGSASIVTDEFVSD